jgi:hypothetical protein
MGAHAQVVRTRRAARAPARSCLTHLPAAPHCARPQAVKYFTRANVILKQYAHMASFEQIRIESEKIMRGLRASLRVAVRDPSMNSHAQMENSALLMHLGESAEGLLSDIFSSRRTRLIAGARQPSPTRPAGCDAHRRAAQS